MFMPNNMLEQHEIAKVLTPPLTKEELYAYEQDILKNGQLDEVVLCDGKVLDKWHMYQILVKHNIKPRFKEFHKNGVESPQDFVIAKLQGRHLNQSQKTCVAIEYDAYVNGNSDCNSRRSAATTAWQESLKSGKAYKAPHHTRKDICNMFNVSATLLNYASVLFFENKELFNKCKNGQSINSAYNEHLESRRLKRPNQRKRNQTCENIAVTKDTIEIPKVWDSREKYDIFMDQMAALGWMFQLRMKNGLYNGHFYGNGHPEYTSHFKEVGAARTMHEAVTQAAFVRLGKK